MEDILALFIGLVAVLIGGLIFLVPVAGFTARFAAKPLVQLFARTRDESSGQRLNLLEKRFDAIEQQLDRLELAYDRISEAREFDRRLAAPAEEAGIRSIAADRPRSTRAAE